MAEKAEIHSGLGGFYHNEGYTERLKKKMIQKNLMQEQHKINSYTVCCYKLSP